MGLGDDLEHLESGSSAADHDSIRRPELAKADETIFEP